MSGTRLALLPQANCDSGLEPARALPCVMWLAAARSQRLSKCTTGPMGRFVRVTGNFRRIVAFGSGLNVSAPTA